VELGDLNLYNTRTRSVEPFMPLREGEVRIYVCGLTPSARAHLGHARSFLFFDVLRRYLIHLGYRVVYVQNVTDIDDRSIAEARATGQTYDAIVRANYSEFKEAMRTLGVLPDDREPYATQYIPQIQAMIRELVVAGHAYAARDGIYYRVASFPQYGSLSNRNISELEAGARVDVDEHKEDPLDFALWKFAKPDEPRWAFEPYGDGRPGWHIECSAMARALLDPEGEGFDIHGGGADLIFPHHENEIAQSQPLMSRPPMANFWLHGGLLLFDNKKMSKSLGNYEPLADLLQRHDPQAIRLFLLQTSYAKVKNFTEDGVEAAASALVQLKKAYRLLRERAAAPAQTGRSATGFVQRIEGDLNADMNTAAALATMLEFAGGAGEVADRAGAGETLYEYAYLLELLGIAPNEAWLHDAPAELPQGLIEALEVALDQRFDGSPQEAIDRVIAMRREARARKDWAASDRLRDALGTCGIVLNDSKDGTTWSLAG
jgi:cysteinyl-tRNA synthetase